MNRDLVLPTYEGDTICERMYEEEGPQTILEALDKVQIAADKSQLSDEFWSNCEAELDFLCKTLELNRIQAVLVAIMTEVGKPMSWRMFGEYLGLSRLKVMRFTPDLEDLLFRRWICQCGAMESGGMYQGFQLIRGVIKAFRHNKRYEPERIDNLTLQLFVERLSSYIQNNDPSSMISQEDTHRGLLQLIELNSHLPLCEEIMNLSDETSKIICILAVRDYACYGGTDSEGICLMELQQWFESDYDFDFTANQLQDGTHELFSRGLIEFRCDNGMIDTASYVFTNEVKEELLGEYKHRHQKREHDEKLQGAIKANEITHKEMYYNPTEREQISRLKSTLSKTGFANVQRRLAESGLRKGLACLFYGSPGTGKTETALQIARETGRDIFKVDVSEIRDKFVGESEKNIREIFKRYRRMCDTSEETPILLFNEADQIVNKRIESPRDSVDKMDNAIQNIILEELETLEGIVIATTNLTDAIDKAFDRRFLFKIEFSRPGLEAKASIWKTMLQELSETECRQLAVEFDFSGGQIENIARKCKIDYVIKGQLPNINQIRAFCHEEFHMRNGLSKVGFFR